MVRSLIDRRRSHRGYGALCGKLTELKLLALLAVQPFPGTYGTERLRDHRQDRSRLRLGQSSLSFQRRSKAAGRAFKADSTR